MGGSDRIGQLVSRLVDRARALDDDDRRRLAEARRSLDEAFHSGAWKAAAEMAGVRADAYWDAWARIGAAYVPDRLEELVQQGSGADPAEVAEWRDVARSCRLGIDDALLAILTGDMITPPDLREMHSSWRSMLEEAHARGVDDAAATADTHPV